MNTKNTATTHTFRILTPTVDAVIDRVDEIIDLHIDAMGYNDTPEFRHNHRTHWIGLAANTTSHLWWALERDTGALAAVAATRHRDPASPWHRYLVALMVSSGLDRDEIDKATNHYNEFHELHVAPWATGYGLGRALTHAAAAEHVNEPLLLITPENAPKAGTKPATSFHARQGFRPLLRYLPMPPDDRLFAVMYRPAAAQVRQAK